MAAYFGKGRTCRSLSPEEGALLLDKLQETARRITPESLGLLGAYALGGEYAKQLGTFEYGSARGARTIRIIDLGLYPWQAIKMGLPVEKLEPDRDKRRQPVSEFVRQYRDESGTDWDKWLQSNRIELNALTPAASMAWLDSEFEKHGALKLVPPTEYAATELQDYIESTVEEQERGRIVAEVEPQIRAATEERLAKIRRRMPSPDALVLAVQQTNHKRRRWQWRHAVSEIADTMSGEAQP